MASAIIHESLNEDEFVGPPMEDEEEEFVGPPMEDKPDQETAATPPDRSNKTREEILQEFWNICPDNSEVHWEDGVPTDGYGNRYITLACATRGMSAAAEANLMNMARQNMDFMAQMRKIQREVGHSLASIQHKSRAGSEHKP